MTGRTVGHFAVLEKLGEGGMGVVYKARDTTLGRIVALKFLSPDRVSDAARRQRFVKEAQSASALNHPHIITLHEIFEFEGGDCICMEYVEGKTLDRLIPRQGMRLSEALRVGAQICDALAKAHAAGIVHRDLKPANVMLTSDGRVKVLDFGLAKLTERAAVEPDAVTRTAGRATRADTDDGTVVGTAPYMSPEQAEGQPVDARSDIFSFGSVLYEMISGQRAFQRASPALTLAAVIQEEPKPLGEVVPALPREIERLVTRCLRKDPARRIQHMDDLKLALEELREESESGALRAGAAPAPQLRRRWIGAAVLAVAAGGGLWVALRPKSVETPKIIAVTSYPGLESQPALSSDGKQVAFVWTGEKQDNSDIYVKLVDTGAPLRLTSHADPDISPAWSPDGRHVAFARKGKDAGYYIIPALGGAERKLTERGSGEALLRPSMAWTPDARFLIAPDYKTEPVCLALIPVDGGGTRCLTTPPPGSFGDFFPSVSPDGGSVVFFRRLGFGVGEYTVASLSNQSLGAAQAFYRVERVEVFPAAWTADSAQVIIEDSFGGQNTLIRIRPRPGAQPQLIPGIGDSASEPSTANGGRLAFAQRKITRSIWRMPLDPRSPAVPERIVATSRSDYQGELSPDGTKIAFASDRTGNYEIWVANVDGSNPVQLSTNLLISSRPRWSYDGRRIAFAARPGGNVDIYAVDVSGGPVQRVTTHPGEDASAAWSRDNRWIYFASNRTGRREIWKIPAAGTAPESQVTQNGGHVSLESEHRQSLLFTKVGLPGIFRMPLQGGPEEKLVDLKAGLLDLIGEELYFLPDENGAIQRVNLKTKAVSKVLEVDEKVLRQGSNGFSLSRDGKWMYHTRLGQAESDIMLLDNFR